MLNSLTEPLRDASRHQNGVGRVNMAEYWPSIPESPISNLITEKQKPSVILYTINAYFKKNVCVFYLHVCLYTMCEPSVHVG